eukprot:gene9443-9523_t
MNLSAEEVERYARHIVLTGVGGPGQKKLKSARVLVIGAGGLGSPLLLYLAAAGVGTLGIADDDDVSLSNLQRQVLHGTPDIGRPKGESARDALLRINPHVNIELLPRLDEINARDMVRGFDIIADGSDNFATRYAVSDACFYEKRCLITAAVGPYDASITTLKPFEQTDGVSNPTYRCLFPDVPPPGMVPACVEAGVLGALTGMVGSMMALEVIREIVGGFRPNDTGLVGKLLLMDLSALRFETLAYEWDPANPLSGSAAA